MRQNTDLIIKAINENTQAIKDLETTLQKMLKSIHDCM